MCDIGRYGFHRFEDLERVAQPLFKSNGIFSEISWDTAIEKIGDKFNGAEEKVAGVVSPFHTNETNFMLGRLIKGIIGTFPHIEDEEITYPSGFRISSDRSPNKRGMHDVCPSIVDDLASKIKKQ